MLATSCGRRSVRSVATCPLLLAHGGNATDGGGLDRTIVHYEIVTYDDPKRSHNNLFNVADNTIMRRREQANLVATQTDRFATDVERQRLTRSTSQNQR